MQFSWFGKNDYLLSFLNSVEQFFVPTLNNLHRDPNYIGGKTTHYIKNINMLIS